jgi:hypothetical protein
LLPIEAGPAYLPALSFSVRIFDFGFSAIAFSIFCQERARNLQRAPTRFLYKPAWSVTPARKPQISGCHV